MAGNTTFENIERPFGAHLEREAELGITAGGEGSEGAGTTAPESGGQVADTPIKSAQSFADVWIDNELKSTNWSPKKTGFYMNGQTGYAEFANVYISGSIIVVAGSTIGGWSVGPDEIYSGNVHLKSTAEQLLLGAATAPLVGTGIFLGKDGSDYEFRAGDPAGAYVHWNGTALAVRGGDISNLGSGSDISVLDLTHNIVFSITDADTVAWASGTITMSNGTTYSISAGNTGNMAARTYVYLDSIVSATVLQVTTTVSTAIGQNKKLIAVCQNGDGQANFQVYDGIGGLKLNSSQINLSTNNWTFSGTWTVTDLDTIAWGAGTLKTSDGTSYSISGGNTGNMAAKSYIYFDLGASATAFQVTTTGANSVGDGKLLIAVAQNGATEANFIVVNDKQLNIDASSIVAGSITANEIAAGAITATKINVSQLSAITADMGALTAGTITLNTTGYIRGGQTAYDTGTGFFLGYSTAAYKLSLGDSAGNKLIWDGVNLSMTGEINASSGMIGGTTITADALTGGLIQTASTGQRVSLSGGDDSVVFKNDTRDIASVSPVFLDVGGSSSEGLIIGTRFEPTDFGTATLLGWWAHDQPDSPEDSDDSSESGLDLSDFGTPGRRTPKDSLDDSYGYAMAMDFNGTTQYLARADEVLLSTTSSISFTTWVTFDVLPSSGNHRVLVSKFQASSNNRSYLFSLYNNAGTYELRLTLSSNGTATETEVVTWTPTVSTWYFVGFSFDAATGNVIFYVNGAQQGATQTSSVTAIYDSTASFALGATEVDGTPSGFLDGGMDETALFTGVLPTAAHLDLYNAGLGKTYSHSLGYYNTGIIMRTGRAEIGGQKFNNEIEIFSKLPAGGINPSNSSVDGISTTGGNIRIIPDNDPLDPDDMGMEIQLTRVYFADTLLPDNDTTRNLGSAALSWNNIYSNNTLNVSDERKKKDIRNFSGGLDKISRLKTKTFKRKGRAPEFDKDEVGLMAQEVLQIFPEAVEVMDVKNKKGEVVDQTYAINQTVLVHAAINAIKELNDKVEQLINDRK